MAYILSTFRNGRFFLPTVNNLNNHRYSKNSFFFLTFAPLFHSDAMHLMDTIMSNVWLIHGTCKIVCGHNFWHLSFYDFEQDQPCSKYRMYRTMHLSFQHFNLICLLVEMSNGKLNIDLNIYICTRISCIFCV